jgi:hypothetical protein
MAGLVVLLCVTVLLCLCVCRDPGRMVWPRACRRRGCVPVGVPFLMCERGARSLVTSEPAAGLRVCGGPPPVPLVGEGGALVIQSGGVVHAGARNGSQHGVASGRQLQEHFARLLGESSARLLVGPATMISFLKASLKNLLLLRPGY